MKNTICIIALWAASLSLFSSCSDWFDISPKTNLKAEELFETESGFQSALAGIYISMGDEEAYGGNLSFGLIDQLAQLYDMIPNGANNREEIYRYNVDTTLGYKTKKKLAESWQKAYNLIANANNLMKWLDKNGERVLTDTNTRNMMRGEALALRAFLHFDLLRAWGPMSYQEEQNTACIPYREVADNSKQPLRTAKQVVEHILADLTQAETLLSFEKGVSLEGNERRFRFNYYAIKALMARVYCYSKDYTKALEAADEVIRNCGLQLQFDNTGDPSLFNETLCAVNLYKMSDELSDNFATGKFTQQYYCSMQTLNILFENKSADMRYKSTAFYRDNASQEAISLKYINNDNEAIPLIRLAEMYYIKCEASPLAQAAQYLNEVRNKRGISISENYGTFGSEEDRVRALGLEYRKEFYAEGQLFYFFKTHGVTQMDYCPTVTFNKDKYVFPLPDAEKEYGWTQQETPEGTTPEASTK